MFDWGRFGFEVFDLECYQYLLMELKDLVMSVYLFLDVFDFFVWLWYCIEDLNLMNYVC